MSVANIGLLLVQRRSKPTLVQCPVFAGYAPTKHGTFLYLRANSTVINPLGAKLSYLISLRLATATHNFRGLKITLLFNLDQTFANLGF